MIINQLNFSNILLNNTVDSKDILYNKIAYGPDGKLIGNAPIDNAPYADSTLDIGMSSVDIGDNHLCYANNIFFSLPSNSNGMYSEDGITWKKFSISSNGYLNSMCYGNGKFVAVGYPSNITYYSEDGINWTGTTTYAPGNSVCYGNGKFVSVSQSSYCTTAYSEDGINWTPSKNLSETYNSTNVDWNCICFGNGKFVAVSRSGVIGAYSEDGINWAEVELPALDKNAYRISMCYGNGKFVVAVQSSNKFIYSEDGINWSEAELPVSVGWTSICYGNGKFVAISSTYKSAYSTDGVNWIIVGTIKGTNSLGYGNNKFIAINQSAKKMMYSLDGIKWHYTLDNNYYKLIDRPIELISKDNYHGILKSYDSNLTQWNKIRVGADISYSMTLTYYADGKFIVLGENTGVAAYSIDGINWIEISLSCSDYWRAICYGKDKFVAMGCSSGHLIFSKDGIIWEKGIMPQKLSWNSVCYGDGKFVAVANSNNNIAAYSEDGITWTQTSMPKADNWLVCYGNGKFVAVTNSNNNIAAYSEDGITWTQTSIPKSLYCISVCYGDGKFIAIGNSNTAYYSDDGITWTQTSMPLTLGDASSICYIGNKFVGFHGNTSITYNYIYTSNNGIDWNYYGMNLIENWDSICYGDGKLVASIYKSTYIAYTYTKKYEIEMLN